ncbi:hypothetical protein BH23ACT8_BH23ACT8_25170 [soil metagenome]
MSTQTPSITQVRDAWDAIADAFDRHATPQTMAFGEQVLSRLELGRGVRVLDVAAGSGGLSIPAARTGADVVAVDIAPGMIDRLAARARAEGLATLEARVGDGAALAFDDDSFDVTVSMNGVSVFPDLPGGLREMARVTRPGGRVLVVAFGPVQEVEFVAFFLGALRATVPASLPPSDEPMPPFRLADPATFQRSLQEAGLRDVSVETATWQMHTDSADHFLEGVLSTNPIASQLTAGLTEEEFAQVRDVLDGMLRERSGGRPGAVLNSQMRIGQATV